MKQNTDRIWAQFLLFASTVLCLWGAWMTPSPLNIPDGASVYAYREVNDAALHWRTQTTDLSPAQADALLALLGAAELRQTVRQNSYAVGDTIYDCGLVEPSESIPEVKIRLFPLDSGVSAYADVDGGRYYRILDPEPLLDFLENELSYT